MANGPIDVAYIEILPDLKKFDSTAERDVSKALKGATRAADQAASDIENSFDDAAKAVSGSMKSAAQDLSAMVNNAAKSSQKYFEETKAAAADLISDVERRAAAADPTVTVDVDLDTKLLERGLKRDVNGKIRKSRGQFASAGELAGLDLGEGIAEGATKGLAGLGSTLSSAVGAAGPYVQTAAVALGVIAASALAPAVAALGLAIPAAAAVGGAAIGTLILGFQGLGDAITNAGDPEKFAESLQKLSPAAQQFAIEIKNLLPAFASIRAAAQEGIFKGFEGELTRVVTVLQGPLSAGFNKVGQSIQEFVKQMASVATSSTGVDTINGLFATTARIISESGPSLQIFLGGIGVLVQKALPFVEKLSGIFAKFLADIGTGLSKASANGTLDEIFSKGLDVLAKVWEIGGKVWDIFKGLFITASSASGPILDALLGFVTVFADFLKDKDNLQAIVVILQGIGYVMQANAFIFGLVLKAVTFLIDGITWLVGEVAKLGKAFPDFAKSVGTAIADAWNSIKKFFSDIGSAVAGFASSAGSKIGGVWDSITEGVSTAFNSVIDFFKKLPGRIWDVLTSLPGLLLDAIVGAFKLVLIGLGVAIGLILFAVLELPKKIPGALASLWSIVSTFFANLWNSVLNWTVTKLTEMVAWLAALPGRVLDAVISLATSFVTWIRGLWESVKTATVTAWDATIAWMQALPGRILAAVFGLALMLGTFLINLWNDIKTGAVNGWNAVIDWIKGIPAKLSNLGSTFLTAGKNMIRSLFDGLASAGEFAGRVGSAVYGAFKTGLNWAIRQINTGISSVDDILPGSLPRIPLLAAGGITTGATQAVVGENGPEAVLPLSGQRGRKTMEMLAQAANGGGTQVTFAPGSVVVEFSGGTAPTQAEAQRTGEAVGLGIAAILAKRDIRTQVRMA